MSSNLPTVDQTVIEEIILALESMQVVLEENPLEFGPKSLNQKTAQARKHLAATEMIFSKISHWIQKYKAAHRTASSLLELDKKALFSDDPETRVGRNAMDRDAIASTKLRPQVEEVSRLAGILDDLGSLMTIIRSKRADLKDIQGRLRDQVKLCQEEIGLGGRWGYNKTPAEPKTGGHTVMDLHRLFKGGEDPSETKDPQSQLDLSVSDTEKGVGMEFASSEEDFDSILDDV